jgi:beta-glucosidase
MKPIIFPAVCLLVSAAVGQDTYPRDGTWKPIAAVLGGARLPDEAVKAITLKLSGDNYEVTVAGEKEPDKGTCAIDTALTPHRMTIKSTSGPNKGKTFLAIYEMKDAVSMRVCYDLSGKAFPAEFKAPAGTSLYLVGYRRAAANQEAENDAVVGVPREGGWRARHQSFNERVKQGNTDLIFIGDSITQGWERAGKAVWDEYYAKRNAVNLGISGDRTQHVLWRLENGNIEGIRPKLAVLMIGTNNAGDNTSEQIAAGVKVIIEKLRSKLPQTKILVLAIFPRGENPSDPRRRVNEGANAIIKGLADGQMVHYLDIGPKFLAADGSLSREVMPDLLHLNESSYRTWAESIEPKVKELLGER